MDYTPSHRTMFLSISVLILTACISCEEDGESSGETLLDPCSVCNLDLSLTCSELQNSDCSIVSVSNALDGLQSSCPITEHGVDVFTGYYLESCTYDEPIDCLQCTDEGDLLGFNPKISNVPLLASTNSSWQAMDEYIIRAYYGGIGSAANLLWEFDVTDSNSSPLQISNEEFDLEEGVEILFIVSNVSLQIGSQDILYETKVFSYIRPNEWTTTRQIQLDTVPSGGYSLNFFWWGD